MQNGFMESFNGRLRDECLNEHLFTKLNEARQIIEAWRIDCNTNRPYTSLDGLTSTEFAARTGAKLEQTLLMNEGNLGSRSEAVCFTGAQQDFDKLEPTRDHEVKCTPLACLSST